VRIEKIHTPKGNNKNEKLFCVFWSITVFLSGEWAWYFYMVFVTPLAILQWKHEHICSTSSIIFHVRQKGSSLGSKQVCILLSWSWQSRFDIHQIIKIPIDMSTLINTNKTVGGVDKAKLGVSNSSVSKQLQYPKTSKKQHHQQFSKTCSTKPLISKVNSKQCPIKLMSLVPSISASHIYPPNLYHKYKSKLNRQFISIPSQVYTYMSNI
jgi:hypothetical protein